MHTPPKTLFSALLGKTPSPKMDEAAPRAGQETEVPNMAAWNPFAKKKEEPEVTPVQPKVTPEKKQLPSEPEAAVPVEPVLEEEESKKKRRGKPQDFSKLTRNKTVQIRMTEEEVARLKEAAKAADMTLADFVLSGVDQKRFVALPGGLEIRKELFREGKNLNQALYLAHLARKEGRPADLQSIMDAVAKVEDNLDRLAVLIETWHIDLSSQVQD